MTDRDLTLTALRVTGLSQCALARQIGVNPRTLRRWLCRKAYIRSPVVRAALVALATAA